jgi:hypothetical protein
LPSNALRPPSDDETGQRETCALEARKELEPALLDAPKDVTVRRDRHQQQWRRDVAPSAEQLLAPPPSMHLP